MKSLVWLAVSKFRETPFTALSRSLNGGAAFGYKPNSDGRGLEFWWEQEFVMNQATALGTQPGSVAYNEDVVKKFVLAATFWGLSGLSPVFISPCNWHIRL